VTGSRLGVDAMDVRLVGGAAVEPPVWEARVAQLIDAEAPEDVCGLVHVLSALPLTDSGGTTWSYDGTTWLRWDGTSWVGGTTTAPLRLTAVTLELPVPRRPDLVAPEHSAPTPAPSTPLRLATEDAAFTATHLVPSDGLPAWSAPDPAAAPVAHLHPYLAVMAVEWRADGWTRVVCSNEWGCWVDGDLLVPAPQGQ